MNYNEKEVYEIVPKEELKVGPVNFLKTENTQNNKNIESEEMNITDSFNKFKNHSFDTNKSNFSSDISSKRGFRTDEIREYELPPLEMKKKEDIETKYQKFMRLKFEVNSFLKELEEECNKSDEKNTTEEVTATPIFVREEIMSLYNQLEQITKEEERKQRLFPQYDKEKFVSLKNNLASQVISKIEEIGKHNEQQDPSNNKDKKNEITFEVYYNPSNEESLEKARAEQLEKRISFVESMVGKNNDQSQFPNENLWAIVENLYNKISLLDEKRLEILSNQIKRTNETIVQLLNQSESSTVSEKVNKIYEMMIKWDEIADSVPSVVDRLKDLKSVHEQTVDYSNNLQLVQNEQSQISQLILSHQQLLQNMESSIKENAKIIRGNTESLENRINQLQQKLNKN
eukprot:TRINITY_DN16646_c0_g1_i1.p1 TRINITY_DN16646_c0_g1~~TRINITY_DN16646_c0_g1_i1.p1  ORF type:complete len:401 (-),score=158.17 TRINITY_DN16646_c0_g1_i1:55-1257(-)